MRYALALGLSLCTLPAQQIVASATAVRGAVIAAKDGLVLPAGEFTVSELIDATASYLCRNYLYDPSAVLRAQGFTLQRPLAVDALGAEELLYALLASRDFVVLPLDEMRGIYQITLLDPGQTRVEMIASTPWRAPEDILRRPQLRELVFTAVELQAADAQEIALLLRNTFNFGSWRPGSLVANSVESHTLVLHGYRDQVATAIGLAMRFDHMCRASTAVSAKSDPVQERLRNLEQQVAELKRIVATQQRLLDAMRR